MTESDSEFEVEYQAELKRIKLQRARDKARRDSEDPSEQFVMVTCIQYKKFSFPIRIKDLDWSQCWELDEDDRWIDNWKSSGVILGKDRKRAFYYFPANIKSAEKIEAYLKSR